MKTKEAAWKRWVKIVGWTLVFFVFLMILPFPASGVPVALLSGWVTHGMRVLPELLADWTGGLPVVVSLLACLWLANWLANHWLKAKGKVGSAWRLRETAAVLGLFLGMSGAAIALSGVGHQVLWLGQTRWFESNRKTDRVQAMSQIRMAVLMIYEFEEERGRMPESWEELAGSEMGANLQRMVPVGRGMEPLILARPGQPLPGNPAAILIVGPQVDGMVVVGRADSSVTSIKPERLAQMLEVP